MQARVYLYTCIIIMSISPSLRDGQLEKGGGGELNTKKNICARGHQMKKIHACKLTLKNIHATA